MALSAPRHAEDHHDQGAARGIDVQPLLDGAAGFDLDDPHVAVGLGSRVLAAFDRPIAAELKWVLVVTAALTMLFILLPDPIVGGAEAAAASLFAR